MSKKLEKEASVVGGIKGFVAGGDMSGTPKHLIRKKKGGVICQMSSDELEEAIAMGLLEEDDIDEIVKKRGEQWVFYDDDTAAQLGVFPDRKSAWERQRVVRRQRSAAKQAKFKEYHG